MLDFDSEDKVFKNKFILNLSDKEHQEKYNERLFNLVKYKILLTILGLLGIINTYFLYYYKENPMYYLSDYSTDKTNSNKNATITNYHNTNKDDKTCENYGNIRTEGFILIDVHEGHIFLSIIAFGFNFILVLILFFSKISKFFISRFKYWFFKAIAIFGIFNFFLQLECVNIYVETILTACLENNYYHLDIIVNFSLNFLRILYFENCFLNNFIATSFSFVLFPSLKFWKYNEIWSLVVKILFYAFWCFFIYKLEKIEKICFVLKENASKINQNAKRLSDSLSSGVVKIKANKIIDFNSKINEFGNFRIEEINLPESNSNLNFNPLEVKNFIFTGLTEFNRELDHLLIENFNELNLMAKNTKCGPNEKDFEDLMNNLQKYSEYFSLEFVLIGKKIYVKRNTYSNNYNFDNNYCKNNQELTLQIFIKFCEAQESWEIMVSDITSIVMNEEFNAQNKYKKLFLNKFSHEFKNPILNVNQLIKDFRNFLKDNEMEFQTLPFQQKETWAEIIKKSKGLKHVNNICNYMTTLITDFDVLANIELTNNHNNKNNFKANNNNNNNNNAANQLTTNNIITNKVHKINSSNNIINNINNTNKTDLQNSSINLLELKNNNNFNNLNSIKNTNVNQTPNKATINNSFSNSLKVNKAVPTSNPNTNKKPITIYKDQVNIRKIIKFCFEIFKTRIELNEKNIDINYLIDDEIPEYIISDERRLKQILVNLLSNSYKFTNNGYIIIKVLKPENSDFSHVFFTVEDSGNGIKSEILQNICEPFRKLDVESNIYGAGLGLYIVKRLIEELGSNLEIISEVQKGTKISFLIDICDDENKEYFKNFTGSENQDFTTSVANKNNISNVINNSNYNNSNAKENRHNSNANIKSNNFALNISNLKKTNILNSITPFKNANLLNANTRINHTSLKKFTSPPVKKWASPSKEPKKIRINNSNKTINNGNTIINLKEIPKRASVRISNSKNYNFIAEKNKKPQVLGTTLISNGFFKNKKSYTLNLLKKFTKISDTLSKSERNDQMRNRFNGTNSILISEWHDGKVMKSSTDKQKLNKKSTENHSHSKFLEPRLTNSSISVNNNTCLNSPHAVINGTINAQQINNNVNYYYNIKNKGNTSNLSSNSNFFCNPISNANNANNNNVNNVNNINHNIILNNLNSEIASNNNNDNYAYQQINNKNSTSGISNFVNKEIHYFNYNSNNNNTYYNNPNVNLIQESNLSAKTVLIESPLFKFNYLNLKSNSADGNYNNSSFNLQAEDESEKIVINKNYGNSNKMTADKRKSNTKENDFSKNPSFYVVNNKLSANSLNFNITYSKDKEKNSKFKIKKKNIFEEMDSRNSSTDKELENSISQGKRNYDSANNLVFLNTFGESNSKSYTLKNNHNIELVSKKTTNKFLSPFNNSTSNNNQFNVNLNNQNNSSTNNNSNNNINFSNNNNNNNSNNNEKYFNTSLLFDDSSNNLINAACLSLNNNNFESNTNNNYNYNYNNNYQENLKTNERIATYENINHQIQSSEASPVYINSEENVSNFKNYYRFKSAKENLNNYSKKSSLRRTSSNYINFISGNNNLNYYIVENNNFNANANMNRNQNKEKSEIKIINHGNRTRTLPSNVIYDKNEKYEFAVKSELEKSCNFTITEKPEFPVKSQLSFESNNYNLLGTSGEQVIQFSFALNNNKFLNILSAKENSDLHILRNPTLNSLMKNNANLNMPEKPKIEISSVIDEKNSNHNNNFNNTNNNNLNSNFNSMQKENSDWENFDNNKTIEKDDFTMIHNDKSFVDCILNVNNRDGENAENYEVEFEEELEEELEEEEDDPGKGIFRVLLVDDEKLIRESEVSVLKKYFKKNKEKFSEIEIVECIDGVECLFEIWLHLQQGIKFDAIITDQSMNFMRGSLLAQIIKNLISENVMYDVKIFMVTSYEPHLITNTVGDVLDEIYTKPLSMDNVRSIFNKF